jgi:GAF domain-containing protein
MSAQSEAMKPPGSKAVNEANRNIDACFTISGFSNQYEDEYEESISHLHQSYLHYFEQDGRESFSIQTKQNLDLDSIIKGVESRIAALQRCRRPLFDSIPRFYDLQLKEMLNHATRTIQRALDTQICVIFLMDKHGKLSRNAMFGVTERGETIDSRDAEKELGKEEYSLNIDSFVGRTTLPSSPWLQQHNGCRFGELHYTQNIGQDMKSPDDTATLARYTDLFGEIHEVIAAPINNRNRTFGVIQIINKFDQEEHKALKDSLVNDRDLIYLSHFASDLSYALLNLERDTNRRLFSLMMRAITRPDRANRNNISNGMPPTDTIEHEAIEVKTFIDNSLISLVQNETLPFNFGVIRLHCKKKYRIASQAAWDINLIRDEDRNSGDILEDDDDTFVNIVSRTQEHIVISDVSPKLTRFHNRKWIQKHGLLTFCCFPLLCIRGKGTPRALGTLSLYTSYKYNYEAKTIELLQAFSDAISTYLYVLSRDTNRRNWEAICEHVCNLFTKTLNP